jgi:hypothetical protein
MVYCSIFTISPLHVKSAKSVLSLKMCMHKQGVGTIPICLIHLHFEDPFPWQHIE